MTNTTTTVEIYWTSEPTILEIEDAHLDDVLASLAADGTDYVVLAKE